MNWKTFTHFGIILIELTDSWNFVCDSHDESLVLNESMEKFLVLTDNSLNGIKKKKMKYSKYQRQK